MNKDLAEAIHFYATKSHRDLHNLLLSKSQDNLIALFNDLLTIYINDRNSSTIREFITVSIAGYQHSNTKIGYNGFKQNTKIGGKPIACEAKPQNIRTDGNSKTPRRLNGGGNFTDYTHKRLAKDARGNLNILASGFVNGELIYILESPFKCRDFVINLRGQLQKMFPKGRQPGRFLRSANFTFEHYKDSNSLKIVYINKEALDKNRINLTKKFFDFLKQKLN